MQDIIMDRNQYITPVSIIRNLVKNSVYAIKIYTNKLCCTSNIKFFFTSERQLTSRFHNSCRNTTKSIGSVYVLNINHRKRVNDDG